MLNKLSIGLLVGAILTFLLSTATTIIGTLKVSNALNDLNTKKVELVEEKVSDIVLTDLIKKVESNQEVTQSSLERLDKLRQDIGQIPAPVTIIKTEVVQATTQKDSRNDAHVPAESDDLTIAVRAIDELWRDYCQRFPGERDCRDRENNLR